MTKSKMQTTESQITTKPGTEPRGFSLNAIFLLVTVCAVMAGMIQSGMQHEDDRSRVSDAAAMVASLCLLIGLIVGCVVGAHRVPKGRNIALGLGVGLLSGIATGAFFIYPPTPAAMLIGCILLIGTASLMRSMQR